MPGSGCNVVGRSLDSIAIYRSNGYIMYKILILLTIFSKLAFTAASENLPTADFNGEGEVKADADYISLNITARSDCQLTPKDAQVAVDEVVDKIDKYLQKLKNADDPHFKVLIDGGYTAPYSRYWDNKTLCEKTFQKNTNITLNIANTPGFSKVFSELQSYILGQFDQETFNGQEVARAYVSIGMPEPRLTEQHTEELSREALGIAFKDAQANFMATIKSCKPHPWKVLSIKEAGSYQPPIMYKAHYMARNMAAAPEAMAAPVRFDSLRVKKSLAVTFSFEGSLCFIQ